MTSRREFLTALPAFGTAFALGQQPAPAVPTANPSTTVRIPLENDWQFRLDPVASRDPRAALSDSAQWQRVTVPHTWQTLGNTPDYVGVAWYRLDFDAPVEWQNQFVRFEFEAAYHTAQVFLNSVSIGEHIGKGYTAFTCDASPTLNHGRTNTLLVRVDNSYSDTMLPRLKSFDWANDGGLTRPVTILVTPHVFVERIEIDATPDLEHKSAQVGVRAVVRNTLGTPQQTRARASIREENGVIPLLTGDFTSATITASGSAIVNLPPIQFISPKLWHFDDPHLYTATVALHGDAGPHILEDVFGVRRFETRGAQFYLNGEPVALMGVERMAGSHPEFGMAETTEWIEANHRDLKELNCVFTRVHWAQDQRVLDFCDRHGILMQEEVPAWGPFTFHDIGDELQRQLEQNGLEQLREMVARDRNHPSIISWGLCNEVDGKNPRSRRFAHVIADEARKLTPSRLLTYASHSLGEHPEDDMAGDFDFISTNEYYGSWHPGGPQDVYAHIDRIRKAFPNKPIVISEYGWCECQPTIPPGDESRVNIVDGHTEVFRKFPEIAGAIYFDYNDYRTLVGDKGVGALKQRVHGVVDLYANRKPSFHALELQASPIERLDLKRSSAGYELRISTRKTFPSYTLRGYRVRWIFHGYDDLPMEGRLDDLANLAPGESLTLSASPSSTNPRRIVVDVLRPTGFSAATAELRDA
jgi:beta-galactosidase